MSEESLQLAAFGFGVIAFQLTDGDGNGNEFNTNRIENSRNPVIYSCICEDANYGR